MGYQNSFPLISSYIQLLRILISRPASGHNGICRTRGSTELASISSSRPLCHWLIL